MKIIICEGITEISLVYNLSTKLSDNLERKQLKNIGQGLDEIVDNCYLINAHGVDNVKNVVKSLLKSPDRKKISKIGFLIDADNSCEKAKVSIEKFKTNIVKELPSCACSYYILPNNSKEGMAETLLLEVASKTNMAEYISNDIYENLNSHDESNISNPHKTKFMIYAASQTPLKAGAHLMLQQASELINFEHENLHPLKEFIKNVIGE